MKRTLITSLLASALLFGGGCSDDFDDSALWKGVDEIYNQLTELEKQADQLNDQIRLLSSIVNGGAITSITQDAEGNDVIRFKGADNIEHSVTVATKDDVSSAPILGTKEENGVLYWTTTVDGNTDFLKDTDGSKIPVAGRTPEMAVDKEGYWTLNDRRLTDASGNPVKAEGKQTSLITGISRDDNGNAIFTLGDGSTVSAPIFDAFNIVFKIGDTAFDDEYTVEDVSQPLTIGYEIAGEKADEAILKIVRCEQLEAVVDTSAETVVVTFETPFEEGCFALMLCDLQENVLIRMVRLASASAKPEYYGIKTADDLREFARAVNTGRNYDRYRDETGDVVLLDDVDMNGITEWTAIGTTEHPFSGKFNGKGHTIRNIAWTADAAKSTAHGLFGVLNQASVRNLTVGGSGDRIIVRGTAAAGTAIAGVAAFATESVIENVANNVSISFEGEDPADTPVMLAGIVGQMSGTTLGGQSAEAGCTNNGDITSGAIANTGNGGKGMQVAGICAYIKNTDGNFMGHCTNNGRVNAPSGRGGGLAGTFEKGTIANSTNAGLVEDDAVGQYAGQKDKYGIKRMGGLVGGSTSAECIIENCTNSGNVISHLGCRTGGFVGHNAGTIRTCKNTGAIIGNVTVAGSDYHGPGWACGYNKSASLISDCIGHGFVGDYDTYKDSPTTAPAAMHTSAVCHKRSNYDTEENTVDWTLPSYYDWELKQTVALHPGVKYTYYEFTNLPRKMHVLELDLTNDAVEISTSMADDLVPNPNGNNNSNNGKNIRETLSENCNRKRAEGQNIIAGINSGFFNSHDGFQPCECLHFLQGSYGELRQKDLLRQNRSRRYGIRIPLDQRHDPAFGQHVARSQPLYCTVQENTPSRRSLADQYALQKGALRRREKQVGQSRDGQRRLVQSHCNPDRGRSFDGARRSALSDGPRRMGRTAHRRDGRNARRKTLRGFDAPYPRRRDGQRNLDPDSDTELHDVSVHGRRRRQEFRHRQIRPDDLRGHRQGRNESLLLRHRRPSGLDFDGRKIL